MEEKNILYALRHNDGGVSLYIDEEWATERGVDASKLVPVEIPRELYASGTVQQLREYVALHLETLDNPEEAQSSS